MYLWLKMTNRKINNGSAVSECFIEGWCRSKQESFSGGESFKHWNPQSQSTWPVQQIEDTALFLVMLPLGGLPGSHWADDAAGPAHWSALSWDVLHLWAQDVEEIVFSACFQNGSSSVCDTMKIKLLSRLKWKQVDTQFIDRANASPHAVPAMHAFSSRCALRSSHNLYKMRGKVGRGRERQTDRMYSAHRFSSAWHPEASPKLLVKKKKRKEKKVAVW